MFMFSEVPPPPWTRSSGNESRHNPPATSRPAAAMASPTSRDRRPVRVLASAAATFTWAIAPTSTEEILSSLIRGKFSSARAVLAPKRALAGMATSPSSSRTTRAPRWWCPEPAITRQPPDSRQSRRASGAHRSSLSGSSSGARRSSRTSGARAAPVAGARVMPSMPWPVATNSPS